LRIVRDALTSSGIRLRCAFEHQRASMGVGGIGIQVAGETPRARLP
jgi:hypothetical protein